MSYIENAICNLLLELKYQNKLTQQDVKEITQVIVDRINRPKIKILNLKKGALLKQASKLNFLGIDTNEGNKKSGNKNFKTL